MQTTNKSMDKKVEDALAFLAAVSVYELSRIAECGSPDSLTSPGAELLDNIRINLIDQLENNPESAVQVSEIAESSISVYTHPSWLQFVDLCAYEEDIAEYMALGSTMTQQAQYALAYLAERLITELCSMLELGIN